MVDIDARLEGFEPTTLGSEVSGQVCFLLTLNLIRCFVPVPILASKLDFYNVI